MENSPLPSVGRSPPSVGRSPFKDLTNTSTNVPANATSNDKPPSRQGWYSRMSAEKKAEYLEKQRMARHQKKAVSVSENSTKPRSSGQGWYARLTDEKKAEYLEKQRISRQLKKMAALTKEHAPSSPMVSPGTMQMGSGQSCVTEHVGTPSAQGMGHMGPIQTSHWATSSSNAKLSANKVRRADLSENEDWLHRNDTYQRPTTTNNTKHDIVAASSMRDHTVNTCPVNETHTLGCSIQMSAGQSYVEPDQHTASEKKRQRAREHYSMMTEEQRGIVLRRNRENKKGRFANSTLSPASITSLSSASPISQSPSTPAMQSRPSKNNPTDDNNCEEESDANGIFEPTEPHVLLEF